ncbi:DUF7064 domain-containing protein [Sphingomonas sp. ID0503]|uniref:DUF7064 domain-containing protein n=1 Tax=Sphingomonas sp. ID0503 TaxID=3399691 RepID=UPI003AFB5172
MTVKLFRPDMTIDPVHDGRHVLEDLPLKRESIPYCVVIPEEKIALFTYTWVNKDSVAGAAFGIWGPGIGPTPIAARLPDREVPRDMNFDDWRIEGFTMKQDLAFNTAEVRWESEAATVDFRFEAFHPPYAYSKHADGCPPYAADDRIEQSGKITGTLQIGDRRIDFATFGHRDHSWGTRDWDALHYYRWLQCQAPDDTSVHFWEFYALGQRQIRGYVCKSGLMAEITDLDVTWQGDEAFNHTAFQCRVKDEAGRETSVDAKVFGVYPLVAHSNFVLNEGAADIAIDGVPGSGWLEFGWPIDYLEHVRAVGSYRPA